MGCDRHIPLLNTEGGKVDFRLPDFVCVLVSGRIIRLVPWNLVRVVFEIADRTLHVSVDTADAVATTVDTARRHRRRRRSSPDDGEHQRKVSVGSVKRPGEMGREEWAGGATFTLHRFGLRGGGIRVALVLARGGIHVASVLV